MADVAWGRNAAPSTSSTAASGGGGGGGGPPGRHRLARGRAFPSSGRVGGPALITDTGPSRMLSGAGLSVIGGTPKGREKAVRRQPGSAGPTNSDSKYHSPRRQHTRPSRPLGARKSVPSTRRSYENDPKTHHSHHSHHHMRKASDGLGGRPAWQRAPPPRVGPMAVALELHPSSSSSASTANARAPSSSSAKHLHGGPGDFSHHHHPHHPHHHRHHLPNPHHQQAAHPSSSPPGASVPLEVVGKHSSTSPLPPVSRHRRPSAGDATSPPTSGSMSHIRLSSTAGHLPSRTSRPAVDVPPSPDSLPPPSPPSDSSSPAHAAIHHEGGVVDQDDWDPPDTVSDDESKLCVSESVGAVVDSPMLDSIVTDMGQSKPSQFNRLPSTEAPESLPPPSPPSSAGSSPAASPSRASQSPSPSLSPSPSGIEDPYPDLLPQESCKVLPSAASVVASPAARASSSSSSSSSSSPSSPATSAAHRLHPDPAVMSPASVVVEDPSLVVAALTTPGVGHGGGGGGVGGGHGTQLGGAGSPLRRVPSLDVDREEDEDGKIPEFNVSIDIPPGIRPSSAPSSPVAGLAPPTVTPSPLTSRVHEYHVDERPIGVGRPGPMPVTDDRDPEVEWLSQLWGEVEFLLRWPLNSESDIQRAMQAATTGLLFLGNLGRVANRLGVMQGTLSRLVLPFDAETATTDQAAAALERHASMKGKDPLLEKLTEEEFASLVDGATTMRSLVRVKIADDNDLVSAKEALTTVSSFLVLLQGRASRKVSSMYEVIQGL